MSGRFKPVNELSFSHADREQNATRYILRFVMRDQIHRAACRVGRLDHVPILWFKLTK